MTAILVRPSKAAHLLDVSRSTVYALIASGELPATRVGRHLRISVSDIRKIAANTRRQKKNGRANSSTSRRGRA